MAEEYSTHPIADSIKKPMEEKLTGAILIVMKKFQAGNKGKNKRH